jgi:hypothetical protein
MRDAHQAAKPSQRDGPVIPRIFDRPPRLQSFLGIRMPGITLQIGGRRTRAHDFIGAWIPAFRQWSQAPA